MSLLAGLRVVEFAQNAAVPMCGRLLAGLGADVVKVEPPEGDAMRGLAGLAPTEGKAFALINPGKRGLVLDLGGPGAGDVVEALFGWADVALVGVKPTDLDRFGLGWEQARSSNPRLIHLTHTAFGPEGPDAQLGGYDVLVQARSGVGFIMNRSDGAIPLPTRPAINDFSSGMLSAFAVMVALRHRDTTGEGQRVDTSLLGTALNLGIPLLGDFPSFDTEAIAEMREDLEHLRVAGVGFEQQRRYYEERVVPAQGAFHLYFRHYATADGLVSVAALSPALYDRFHRVTAVARPDSQDPTDAGFQSVVAEAEATFRSRTTDDWLAALTEAGVPCAHYLAPFEALDDEQSRANDYVVELDHPTFGRYTTVGMPVRFEQGTAALRGPSPRLGQHTVEVLADIGMSARTTELLASGTARQAADDGSE